MDESVTRHLDQPAKTLKLSEAIRIGSRIRPKCCGQPFRRGMSCAIGAAYEAIYGHPGDSDDCREHARIVASLDHLAPSLSLGYDIGMARNDHGWTREQIADWLQEMGY